jgi:hypothetical protein
MEIPDYSSGFGWGQTRLRLGHDGKEEDTADSQGPHVSDSRERGARVAVTPRLAHAAAGKNGGNGLLGSTAQAERGRTGAGRLGSARAGFQATGPQVRFLFFFFSFLI